MSPRSKEIIGVSVILGVTLFFSLFHLTESPPVWYDEGIYSQAAYNLSTAGVAGFEVLPQEYVIVPQLSVGYPLLYPLAAVFKLFGHGVLQARLLMVFFIISLVGAGYLLLRMKYDTRTAMWGTALLALFPPLYGNGKTVLGEVPGTFYFVLALVFLSHALISSDDGRRILRIVGAGFCAGFAMVTKPVFILILPALFFTGILKWKKIRFHKRYVIVGGVSLIVPLLVWFVTQFSQGGSLGEVLAFYSNPSHVADITATIANNLRNMVTDLGPLTLTITLVVWLASVIIRIRRRISIPVIEVISLTFCIVSVAAYLRTAGYYRYLFPYQAVALLFFPQALFTIAESLTGIWSRTTKRGITLMCTGIFSLMLVAGAYQLFFSSWVADAYGYDRTEYWQNYFKKDEIKRPVYYHDVPEVAFFDRKGNYFQYINMAPAAGINVGGELIPFLTVLGIPATIIVETDVYSATSTGLFKGYRPVEEVYKYTILERLSS